MTNPDDPSAFERSRSPRIERLTYDAASVERMAETLAVSVETAPFRLPSATVWQLTVPGRDDRPAALLTLWPSIRRVDVIAGPATIVFTEVDAIELVPDVEVQFRRGGRRGREYLIVARGGKVIVRA
jgi:hypothetical protein